MSAIQLENRRPPAGGLIALRSRIAQHRRRRRAALAVAVVAIVLGLLRPVATPPPDLDVPLARLLAPVDRTVAVENARVVPVEASAPGVRLVWVVAETSAGS